MKKIALCLAVFLGLSGPALAQNVKIVGTLPPFGATPSFLHAAPIKGGNATLSVSTSTGNVAIPASTATYPALLLLNDGAVELNYELGNGSVTATTSSARLPAGGFICIAFNGATNVAAITASGTSTLALTQLSACPLVAGAGGGGASGSVTITGTLPAFAATPTFNIGTAPTIAVTGTFWQATQPISAASLPLPTGAALDATVAALKTPVAPTVGASAAITSLVLKASATANPGGVARYHAENATATSGYCVLYNATAAPGTGALTAGLVLDFQLLPGSGYCDADFTMKPIAASAGAVLLLTSAVNPYTYTTGAITGSIVGVAQ